MDLFDTETPVVGMAHLPPLPGSPRYDGDFDGVRERLLSDARTLEDGGIDGIVVENFGDAPFYPDDVPKHVVASMTALASDLRREVDVPLGVNVLRNDADAALSVATATDCEFVRVNVHTGARLTDQGVVEGRAHETLRLRERLDSDVQILADVDVKHSAPLADRPVEEVVADTLDRGLADGLVVSGVGTGAAVESEQLKRVVAARDDLDSAAPVFVGSGVTPENVRDIATLADGVVVGTALKAGRVTTNPVDEESVADLVARV